ncbi:MAG: methyltransferase domain-containing protein [Alphaproteobacteria bacterium]|jgi:ubiquinone/menaquinone biosynthesis C-methylase UbiE|nr:methyltransferase domain-containing protein [Alphaproteobacteria bacterium]MDP6815375.1 methyltransferase domain-containing protein [Alphaproteobacteria bacterium]
MTQADTDRQRQTAQELWLSRADAWDKWADQLRQMAERMNQPLLQAAELAPGLEVLDLASGIGQPALSIAAAVAPGGRVVASDVVGEMLDGARRRAEQDGLDNISFEVVDMEAMPFPAGSFDRVTCRFGLMFTPEPALALAEALRVLRPDGLAAFMVWGPEEDVTMFQVINQTVRACLGESPHDQHEFTPFRLGQPGHLEGLFKTAGFGRAEEREIRFQPKIDAGVKFWQANLEMSLGQRYQALSEAKKGELDRALVEAFAPYIRDGRYHLQSHARVGIGRP